MNSIMKIAGFIYVYLCVYTNIIVVGEVFNLGYLTGSQRRSGNLEYARPGMIISLPYVTSTYSPNISENLWKPHTENFIRRIFDVNRFFPQFFIIRT